MKKILLSAILTLLLGVLFAQTPESVLKSCPKIPSVETLKNWALYNCEFTDPYEKFREEVYSFQNKLDDNISLVREKINKINEENITAMDKANAADKKSGAAKGTKTFEDIENMSEAEIIAMGMSMIGSQNLNPQNIMKVAELSDEAQTLAEKIAAEDLRVAKETDALIAKHEALLSPKGKYEKVSILQKKLWDLVGEVSEREIAEINKLCNEYKPLASSYYESVISEWLKYLENLRAVNKKMKVDHERLVAIKKEITILSTSAAGISAANTAEIEASGDLKLLQWEFLLTDLELMRKSTEFVKP